jgi:hypothetical protein
MARNKNIRIAEDEKELLEELSLKWFGTTEVPYGYVIKRICMEKLAVFKVAEQYEDANYVYERKMKFEDENERYDATSEDSGVSQND